MQHLGQSVSKHFTRTHVLPVILNSMTRADKTGLCSLILASLEVKHTSAFYLFHMLFMSDVISTEVGRNKR